MRLNCRGCQHFFITYDPHRPWGCRQFGFKSHGIPARLVYESTGIECAYYQPQRKPPQTKLAHQIAHHIAHHIDKKG